MKNWTDRVKCLVAAYQGEKALAAEMGASPQAVKTWLSGKTPSGIARRVIESLEAAPGGVIDKPKFRRLSTQDLSQMTWSGRVKNLVDYLGSPEVLAVEFRVTASAVRNWLGKIVPSRPVQYLIELLEEKLSQGSVHLLPPRAMHESIER